MQLRGLDGSPALEEHQLSNAALFELLDPEHQRQPAGSECLAGVGLARPQPSPAGRSLLGTSGRRPGAFLHSHRSGADPPGVPAEADGHNRQKRRRSSALHKALCQQPGVRLAVPEHNGTDAHLAALAIANGWRLVSFDRDFERFEGLEPTRLGSIRLFAAQQAPQAADPRNPPRHAPPPGPAPHPWHRTDPPEPHRHPDNGWRWSSAAGV